MQPTLIQVIRSGNNDLLRAELAGNKTMADAVVDENGNRLLHIAAALGNIAAIQLLLSVGAGIDLTNNAQATPLWIAVANNQEASVSALIVAKADLNKANEPNATPLFMAAREGFEKIAVLLLEAGANPNIANCNRVMPYDTAVNKGHQKLAALFAHYAKKAPTSRSQDMIQKILQKRQG